MVRLTLNNCDQILKDALEQDLETYIKDNSLETGDIRWAEIGARVEEKRASLEAQGKSFDSFIEGSTVYREKDVLFNNIFAEHFKENLFDRKRFNDAEEAIISQRIFELHKNSEYLKKFYPKVDKSVRDIKAWKALIFNSNDSYGHQTLESAMDSAVKMKTSAVLRKVQELLPDEEDVIGIWTRNDELPIKKKIIDPVTGVEKEVPLKFQEAVIKEIMDIAINGEILGQQYKIAANKITSGDKTANALARALYEALIKPTWHELNSLGRRMNPYENTPKILFKKYKIKKMGEEKFIKEIADNLHNAHGDATARLAIAKRIHDKIMLTGDWRDADTVIKQIRTTEIAINSSRDPNLQRQTIKERNIAVNKPSTLRWKDGDAFLRVNDQVGGDLSLQEMLNRLVNESGRQVGLVRFFGPEYEKTFTKLRNSVESGTDWREPGLLADFDAEVAPINTNNNKVGSFLDRKMAKAANDYVEHLVKPHIAENIEGGPISTFLGTVRNLQVVKLGTALISNVADLATFWTVARNRLGSNKSILSAITGHDFVGSNSDRRLYASAYLDFAEVFVGTMQDRFRMLDHSGISPQSQLGDKALRGSARMAHTTLKWSGFNWWNRTASIGATTLIQREIGDMLSNKKAWATLKPEQRSMFEKFGFNEFNYKELLSAGNDALDGSGRFNIFGYEGWLRKNGVATSNDTVSKLISIVNDLTESMVIKPGAIDRAAIGFFAKPGTVTEQVMRSITQFKTFMVSHSRKILMNEYRGINQKFKERDLAGVVISTAHLVAPMMILSYAVIQLKQLAAGKNPYNNDETVFREMMQYTNIIPFVGDMYWQNGGEQLFNIWSLKEGEKTPRGGISTSNFFRNILGPALSDFESFTKAFMNLGESGLLQAQGKGRDAQEVFKMSVSQFTKTFQGVDFIAQIWYTKALWRSLVYDSFLEYMDPKKYKNTQRRLQKRATDERMNGELYNWVFKDLYK
jgi:hypothetical protein